MSTSQTAAEAVEYYPPRDRDREPIDAPIDEVTLLEDRAQVRRRARTTFTRGHHKLVIEGVSPIIQDVSLRAEVSRGSARVADISLRRAIRARHTHKPEEVQLVERQIQTAERAWSAAVEEIERLTRRAEQLHSMLEMSATEIPQDAAWGESNAEGWRAGMETLFTRHRDLITQIVALEGRQRDFKRDYDNAVLRRQVMGRPDQEFTAWIELDLVFESEETVELLIDYVVPNAMWRPIHSARLDGDVLSFTSKAALWQNTGEDWQDVQLIFSTARSSLGTEPPILHDDMLQAQRKQEETVIAAREVQLQSASVGGSKGGGGSAPPAPQGVELPGVDDGGDVQSLRAELRATIPSDGQPALVELFEFKALAEVERVLIAELTPSVLLRSIQRNTSASPVLAGPVELVRDAGPVGWTSTLFVAPGERFELGFGPVEALRAGRQPHLVADDRDPNDSWRHRTYLVQLFLSNLSDEARTLHVTERVPVSELEKVKIFIVKNKTTEGYEVDDDGIVAWKLTLEPYQRRVLTLQWRLSTAPDVTYG